jgi:hypothetical protein
MLVNARVQEDKPFLHGYNLLLTSQLHLPKARGAQNCISLPKVSFFYKFLALWNEHGQLLLQFLAMPVYGYVFLFTELAHFFRRTNCSALKQELAGF